MGLLRDTGKPEDVSDMETPVFSPVKAFRATPSVRKLRETSLGETLEMCAAWDFLDAGYCLRA